MKCSVTLARIFRCARASSGGRSLNSTSQSMTLPSATTMNEVKTMSIENTGITRRPTHPGEMLREDFLP